ncbi:hypothetical protein WK70_13235 [Burkholderia cepacia]|nr:hypothetical protein WK70_13235 [Burkholderia cepacia]
MTGFKSLLQLVFEIGRSPRSIKGFVWLSLRSRQGRSEDLHCLTLFFEASLQFSECGFLAFQLHYQVRRRRLLTSIGLLQLRKFEK